LLLIVWAEGFEERPICDWCFLEAPRYSELLRTVSCGSETDDNEMSEA